MGLSKEQQRNKVRDSKPLPPIAKPKKIRRKKEPKQVRKHKHLARTNYPKYLKSERWKMIKELCHSMERFTVCLVRGCDENIVDVHHIKYNNLGTSKEIVDLIPLCRKHHFQVHELEKSEGLDLTEATMEIVNQ